MLGLFNYSYDYYEWEYLVCVSESRDKLITQAGNNLLYTEVEHCAMATYDETSHLMIKEVELI